MNCDFTFSVTSLVEIISFSVFTTEPADIPAHNLAVITQSANYKSQFQGIYWISKRSGWML